MWLGGSVYLVYIILGAVISKSCCFVPSPGVWSPAPGSVSLEIVQKLPLGQMSQMTSPPRVCSGLLRLSHMYHGAFCAHVTWCSLGGGPRVTPEQQCFKVQMADRNRWCGTRNAAAGPPSWKAGPPGRVLVVLCFLNNHGVV